MPPDCNDAYKNQERMMATAEPHRAERCLFFVTFLAVWFLFMLGPLAAVYLTANMGTEVLRIVYVLWGFVNVACLLLIGYKNVTGNSH
jgi:hypothetical protein